MNPIYFALRHPITTMMLVVALIGSGGLALTRMRIDIFPPIDVPQIYVVCEYGGMDPGQIEGLLVSQFEEAFQYADGVSTIESRCIQQVAVIKLSFFQGVDMAKALASVVSESNRAMSAMPPSTLPPLIMQIDEGTVPTGYLVLESDELNLGELGDLANVRLRPLVQAMVPGTVATAPCGANIRSIVVKVNPERLRAYNLTPNDVVESIATGNVISPSGNVYIRDAMPMATNNAMIDDPVDFLNIPLRAKEPVYLRDVGAVVDATDINYGYALVDGRKAIYLPIVKKSTASTLQVVADVHKSMHVLRDALPESAELRFEFSAAPTVVASMTEVATEGLIGATLTGLMILVFLHDWRSVVVVVFNIPLALLGSVTALWITGNTLNIMTLGGLALAIGILVDEATVTIENIHVQLGRTNSLARAVERAGNETAVPRLLSLLCILSVFIPAFIMTQPVRSLFVPLALAVGFAMMSSYILSSTVVPVLSVWLLRLKGHKDSGDEKPGLFARMQERFGRVSGAFVRRRWIVVPVYLAVSGLVLWQVGVRLGRELFPQVNSNKFAMRFRAPPGSNYEITRQIGQKIIQVIQEEAGEDNVMISMGFVGQQAPVFAMNNLVLFMSGPDDGYLRFAMRDGTIELSEFRERLRKVLPDRVKPWLAEILQGYGLTAAEAQQRADRFMLGFEPGDIVGEVMSFGASTPIEIMVASPDLNKSHGYAEKIRKQLEKITCLRDLQYKQELDYPTVPIEVNRQLAGLSGLTMKDIADSTTVATCSSRYIVPNYWIDTKSGVDYQVEVLVPGPEMNSAEQLATLPLSKVRDDVNTMIRDVATVSKGVMPGQFYRQDMQRYLSLTANIEHEDLGRAAAQIEKAIKAAGEPPRGVRVKISGQIPPMYEMFGSLAIGLAVAIIAILVMLTAYFESPRLAVAAISAVPGVLAGVVLMLYVTDTTLNIESFMGAIMCIGVSMSNSVMLVTFIARGWRDGHPGDEAAVSGARERLRPILMTACAMIVGMVPMSLALESGSQMEAPLGRAVIGGLLVSTFAVLLIVPAVFTLLIGHRDAVSPSLHPDDPKSRYYNVDEPLVDLGLESSNENHS